MAFAKGKFSVKKVVGAVTVGAGVLAEHFNNFGNCLSLFENDSVLSEGISPQLVEELNQEFGRGFGIVINIGRR